MRVSRKRCIPASTLAVGSFLSLSVSGAFAAAAKTGLPIAEPGLASNLLHMILGLLVVVAIILAGAWLLRRFGRISPGRQGALRILDGLSVGPRERLVLVQVGDTQLLLGVAAGRVQTLHVLDKPLPPIPDGRANTGNFAVRLGDLLKQRGLS